MASYTIYASLPFLILIGTCYIILKVPQVSASNGIVLGYFPNWCKSRSGILKYDIPDIRGDLITHLLYAFLGTDANGNLINSETSDYPRLQQLKVRYPNLKIIPSVGGATYTYQFQALVLNQQGMVNFAKNCAQLVKTYGFDGIDIDWEEPRASEKNQYIQLLQLLRNELGTSKILMSVLPASRPRTVGFDVPRMIPLLDYFGVMTYDFHGSWDAVTGHNAPLVGSGELHTKGAMELWESLGTPKNKLLVGLAFYGRTWTLSSSNTQVGAPGSIGKPSALYEGGIIAYVEIKNNNWPEQWDSAASVPYAFNGNQWVSYDNNRSLEAKIEFTCSTKQYPGVLIWDLSFDPQAKLLSLVHSVTSRCSGSSGGGNTPAPTTQTTHSSSNTQTTTHTTTRPPTTTTISSGGGGNGCTSNLMQICIGASFGELRAFPPDCTRYVNCVSTPVTQPCGSGLNFNPGPRTCDWPNNYQCPNC